MCCVVASRIHRVIVLCVVCWQVQPSRKCDVCCVVVVPSSYTCVVLCVVESSTRVVACCVLCYGKSDNRFSVLCVV